MLLYPRFPRKQSEANCMCQHITSDIIQGHQGEGELGREVGTNPELHKIAQPVA